MEVGTMVDHSAYATTTNGKFLHGLNNHNLYNQDFKHSNDYPPKEFQKSEVCDCKIVDPCLVFDKTHVEPLSVNMRNVEYCHDIGVPQVPSLEIGASDAKKLGYFDGERREEVNESENVQERRQSNLNEVENEISKELPQTKESSGPQEDSQRNQAGDITHSSDNRIEKDPDKNSEFKDSVISTQLHLECNCSHEKHGGEDNMQCREIHVVPPASNGLKEKSEHTQTSGNSDTFYRCIEGTCFVCKSEEPKDIGSSNDLTSEDSDVLIQRYDTTVERTDIDCEDAEPKNVNSSNGLKIDYNHVLTQRHGTTDVENPKEAVGACHDPDLSASKNNGIMIGKLERCTGNQKNEAVGLEGSFSAPSIESSGDTCHRDAQCTQDDKATIELEKCTGNQKNEAVGLERSFNAPCIESSGDSCHRDAQYTRDDKAIIELQIDKSDDADNILLSDKASNHSGDEDHASSSFSEPIAFSGMLSYSGMVSQVPHSGNLSLCSESSTSTRSFAFPVLASEWNGSPAKIGPPDSRYLRRHRRWHHYFCCKRPATMFD
ncbi:hypothetical protein KP509_17G065900 [Ceratopteris richardii]|uniref:Uncharacterized protein n=1 Tax=Ceratopteris richardii TaxID=49495 RepID=A0A8T2T088_CERRI|nr:hypothetical protein KP509_17G065900 [Ceratopteris richardii]KAH7373630.1 hypothetical protein KP509_17G065900 [Ceratopteris richardii]